MAESAFIAMGVMATTAPTASASVLERTTVMRPEPSSQRCTSPQVSAAASDRRRPGVGECRDQGHVKLGSFRGLLGCLDAAAALARLDGGEPNHGQYVGGESSGLALGLGKAPSPSF